MTVATRIPVKTYTLKPACPPVVFEPEDPSVSLVNWAAENLDILRKPLQKAGALLFRGFKLAGPGQFEALIRKTMGEPIHYAYASTPRTKVMSNIYTSTEYPAGRTIQLHNEMAYTRYWPRHLFFFCHTPAASGGQTPIADSRRVYAQIPDAIKEAFEEKGLCYVRNYDGYLDLSWQKAFATTSRMEVAERCAELGIDHVWLSPEHLRTSQRCDAVQTHPETGQKVWFNQAHLFHVSALDPEIREHLLIHGEENLPRNVTFGDGSPIPDAMLAEVREILAREQRVFDWQKGDVMLVDNLLAAHGRLPFSGKRKVLVGMTA